MARFHAMTLPSRSIAKVGSGRNSMISCSCCSEILRLDDRYATTAPVMMKIMQRNVTVIPRSDSCGPASSAIEAYTSARQVENTTPQRGYQ